MGVRPRLALLATYCRNSSSSSSKIRAAARSEMAETSRAISSFSAVVRRGLKIRASSAIAFAVARWESVGNFRAISFRSNEDFGRLAVAS